MSAGRSLAPPTRHTRRNRSHTYFSWMSLSAPALRTIPGWIGCVACARGGAWRVFFFWGGGGEGDVEGAVAVGGTKVSVAGQALSARRASSPSVPRGRPLAPFFERTVDGAAVRALDCLATALVDLFHEPCGCEALVSGTPRGQRGIRRLRPSWDAAATWRAHPSFAGHPDAGGASCSETRCAPGPP